MGGEKHPDGVATYPATEEDLASFDRASRALAAFQAPVLVDGRRPDDRLFVAAFDGTGNSRSKDAPENHTNVARIHDQILGYAKGEEQRQGYSAISAGYVEGVGTQGGLGGTRDLISGRTYEARLEEMYLQFATQAKDWIDKNPDADIRLAAIGFSRGAEQAAGFTRMVEARGIRNPEGAEVVRGRDGLIERVTYIGPPLREPGTVVQAAGLFDPVGTGVPRDHDRRLAASVVSGFQITADDERRNLFQGTRITDPGVTEDGRFLNVTVAGAHSDIGGSYRLDGLSIRSGNLMVDYLNALSDRPFLHKREEPADPERNVIHRSEEHQFFYRTSLYDRQGARAHQEDLAPAALCRIDCRDAEPRDEALAAGFAWRPVPIAPVPGARAEGPPQRDGHPMVDRLLDAAQRGDGGAIDRIGREYLDGADGRGWLQSGQRRLQEQEPMQPPEREPPERMREPSGLVR